MKIRRKKLIIYVLAGIILAKILITLVSLPKITVDYVAVYNEHTKPAAFNPEDNAADHYLQALRLYKEPSEALDDSALLVKWRDDRTPFYEDIDPNDMQLLETWLQSNKPVFDQIKLAIQKPYAWFLRESEDGSQLSIRFVESAIFKDMREALIYSAKVNAIRNDFTAAANDILVCYQVGQHKCRENLMYSKQCRGLRIEKKATKAALMILSYSKPSAEELKYLQDSLQAIIDKENYLPGISAEKIFKYDLVQRFCLDWIRGINRPAFRVVSQISCMCDDNNFFCVSAFTGPSRTELICQIDRLFELHEQLRDKTPWQIHHQYSNLTSEIEAMDGDNFFGEFFAVSYHRLFTEYYESKAQTEALVTVLAALRYKADNSKFPDTLEELVSSGYMKTIPKDPYSQGNLIYKVTENDFKLYSFGKDFEDNKAEARIIESEETVSFGSMDEFYGFTMTEITPPPPSKPPVTQKTTWKMYKDIMYWPKEYRKIIIDEE